MLNNITNRIINDYNNIVNYPISSILLILNIIFIEIVLSVDNVIVLSTLISNVNIKYRNKVIKYGIIFSCIFRLLSLLLLNKWINIKFFRYIGGIYLIYISLSYIYNRITNYINDNIIEERILKSVNLFNSLWLIIFTIEITDIIFSIDNILSIASITNNIFILSIGLITSILIMRISSKSLSYMIEYFKYLEIIAYIIVLFIGIKILIK